MSRCRKDSRLSKTQNELMHVVVTNSISLAPPYTAGKAVDYLTQSAESANQYAQYTLGKLYLEQDWKTAWHWFSESAAQDNQYAQFFLDH